MPEEKDNNDNSVFKVLNDSATNIIESIGVQTDNLVKRGKQKKKERLEKKRMKEISPMARSASGNVSGPLFIVVGLIILGITLGYSAVLYFLDHREILFVVMLMFIPFVFALLFLYFGIVQNTRAGTYAAYRKIFLETPYASVAKLAEETHQSPKRCRKNLEYFLREGLYPKAFFTDDQKYFVLSEGALEMLEEALANENKVQTRRNEEDILKEDYPGLFRIYNQIDEIRTEVKNLKDQKAALRKPQLQDELVEMDYNLKQIQAYILTKPQDVPDLHNFLDYFLPTVIKLVETYCELDKATIRTKNITESQKEIEDGLKSINEAFKNMYNDFYMGTAMDVYSDVQVLKQMIDKNGLGESEFGKN